MAPRLRWYAFACLIITTAPGCGGAENKRMSVAQQPGPDSAPPGPADALGTDSAADVSAAHDTGVDAGAPKDGAVPDQAASDIRPADGPRDEAPAVPDGALPDRTTPLDTAADRGPPSDGGTDLAPTTGDPGVIPRRAPQPDLSRAVNVDTFTVTDDLPRGPIFVPPTTASGRIGVVGEATYLMLPPCGAPVRWGAKPPGTITIDGDLADWQGVAPALIDREGDGISGIASGSSIDLRRVYQTRDDTHYYFAFLFKDEWPAGEVLANVTLVLSQIDLPTATARLNFAPITRFTVQPGRVAESGGLGSSTTIPEPRARVAARGRVIEVRLARAELETRVRSSSWMLDVSATSGFTELFGDRGGAIIEGLTADYACLVPLPGRRFKMMVFRRAGDVQADEAEVIYRAAAASAPYVESETGQSFDLVDTINVTAVRTMPPAGLHHTTGGIAVKVEGRGLFGGLRSPLDLFEIAAHEYAHGLNAIDWALPQRWITEGHSEHSARRATRAAFNEGVGQPRYRVRLADLIEAENASGIVGLEPEPWQTPGKTEVFFYHKAEAFTDLLTTLLPYERLNTVWARGKGTGARYADGTEVRRAITMQPGFGAPVSEGMWNGWFSSSYTMGVLPRTLLESDGDADGLLDHQERQLGLTPEKADMDGDGISDLFELAARSDPKVADPLRGLAADNLLADWDRLAPALLKPPVVSGSSALACAQIPRLVRAGVLFDGEWLLIGLELDRAVTDPSFVVQAAVRGPASRLVSLQAEARPPLVSAFEGAQQLWSTAPLAPLLGGKQLEIAYHRSWLGWGAQMPAGTTVRLGTAVGSGVATTCETTAELTPSTAVP